jgi:hypothetical protein
MITRKKAKPSKGRAQTLVGGKWLGLPCKKWARV